MALLFFSNGHWNKKIKNEVGLLYTFFSAYNILWYAAQTKRNNGKNTSKQTQDGKNHKYEWFLQKLYNSGASCLKASETNWS